MGIRPIILFPDPGLSKPCQPAPLRGDHIIPIIKDLADTMYHSPGVGLAAPQIGINKRISVIDINRHRPRDRKTPGKGTKKGNLIALVNPVLVKGEGLQTPREGCLSVPDLLANVRRFQKVQVKTFSPSGRQQYIEASGFLALALQHEIDHLNGKLFLDRVSNLKTDVFRRKAY